MFKLDGKSKTTQAVGINGDFTYNTHGVPTGGAVDGTFGWSPAFSLFTHQLHFEEWDKLKVQLAVTENTDDHVAAELTWDLDGVSSFLNLPDNDVLSASGTMKSRISGKGC